MRTTFSPRSPTSTWAGIVTRATDYAWSSAAAHCGLVAAPPEWLALETLHRRVSPVAWRERLAQTQPRGETAALRRATRTEFPLGRPGFVEELEDFTSRLVHPRRTLTTGIGDSIIPALRMLSFLVFGPSAD